MDGCEEQRNLCKVGKCEIGNITSDGKEIEGGRKRQYGGRRRWEILLSGEQKKKGRRHYKWW